MTAASFDQSAQLFEFLLLDAFSMMSVTSAIEPLRAANRILGWDAYKWRLVSEDGLAVLASNGISVNVEGRFGDGKAPNYTFVCAGLTLTAQQPTRLSALLNQRFKERVKLGAVSMGAIFLARAGLLKDVRCTMHWEGQPAFREEFPEIEMTQALFEIDRDIYTCAGGISSVDLFLHLIGAEHGDGLTRAIANQFQVDRVRNGVLSQRVGSTRELENAPKQVLAAIKIIAENIEKPLSTDEVAKRVNLSRRTMERLFARYTGVTPSKYCKNNRLEYARDLVLHTNMSTLEVAIASGFQSGSYFSSCFSEYFGQSPSKVRRELSADKTSVESA